jgi:hypothetical protein
MHMAILRYNMETIVNFEPKSNCEYHLSTSLRNLHDTFQEGVDIFSERYDETNIYKPLT